MATEAFSTVRSRFIPMLEQVAELYRGRVPLGYPSVIDIPEQETAGIEIDPSYALFVVREGDQFYADLHRRAPRNDARSSASRMKHGGMPFADRRPLGDHVSDQKLRNLLAELMTYYNQQPGLIHISDA
jgi:hypothetical protein